MAYKLRSDAYYDNKSILIVDKDSKTYNDRTWCFWTKSSHAFKEIVHHSWPVLEYKTDAFVRKFHIEPYTYQMIRGIDFYKHTRSFLSSKYKTDFATESIIDIQQEKDKSRITTDHSHYEADYVFKSYPDNINQIQEQRDHFIWQHFKGLVIKTREEAFDPGKATLMDFRVEQDGETRFFYVLPVSPTEALVELAIFSESVPEPRYYDTFLDNYIRTKLSINEWKVTHTEVGAIPMTTYDFKKEATGRVIRIGTNGGGVKASSGYAFTRIQQQVDKVLVQLKTGKFNSEKKGRFDLYDRVLLNAILTGKASGKEVFDGLFKKLSAQTIFKFLDGEGGLINDLKVFSGPPTLPFLKAMIEEIS